MFAEINIEWDSSGKNKGGTGPAGPTAVNGSASPIPLWFLLQPGEGVVTGWEWGEGDRAHRLEGQATLLSPSHLGTCSEGGPLSLQNSAYQKCKELELWWATWPMGWGASRLSAPVSIPTDRSWRCSVHFTKDQQTKPLGPQKLTFMLTFPPSPFPICLNPISYGGGLVA